MTTQRLTTKFIESVRPDPGRQVAYPDAHIGGLELRVSPRGRKMWSLRYRTTEGRQRRISLGVFPAVDLGDARKKANKVLGAVSDGGDPARDQRQAREAERSRTIRTFDQLADTYLEACRTGLWRPKNKTKRPSTLASETAVLRRHIRPVLGALDLGDLTRRRIRNLLAEMTGAGIGAQANKTHAVIRQVCAYAISEELMEVNPAIGLPPPADQKPRQRVLTDAEIEGWWRALEDSADLRLPARGAQHMGDAVTVGRPMRIALQLATLLLQRRGEVAGMAVTELDLDQRTWTIPGERSKNGKPHLVPLPHRAVKLIREALALAKEGHSGQPAHVFPSRHKPGQGFRPDSLSHAMAEITLALGIVDATPHDLRRTGSTAMTSERLRVSPFIRSKVLGHTSDAGGGAAVSAAHYDANEYVADKRDALEAWEGLLLEIAGERSKSSQVISMTGRPLQRGRP
ncbi:MAG: tyrosine-type recombinase/integrase [Phenylobacterium sp.]|nr:tyrosine-type recombinase/integrase [Phenylobacterium sp.]